MFVCVMGGGGRENARVGVFGLDGGIEGKHAGGLQLNESWEKGEGLKEE